jgi:hypothetical protein
MGIRRANQRIVPVANPQPCRVNACGNWAFQQPRKWRRDFGPAWTGAGDGIRTLGPNLGRLGYGKSPKSVGILVLR